MTFSTLRSTNLLGRIEDGGLVATPAGRIVMACVSEIPAHYPHAEVRAWAVMPNHVHLVLILGPSRTSVPPTRFGAVSRPLVPGSLGSIIGKLKEAATKRINALGVPGARVWRTRYHDRILPDEEAVGRAVEYVRLNPERYVRRHGGWKGRS